MNWVRTKHRSPDQIGDRAEGWVIISSDGSGTCVATSRRECLTPFAGPFHFASVEDAKQAIVKGMAA